ncbi:MAG TPA: hypothetical protein VIJ70_01200 [Gaiellaceae bacterium]
MVAAFYSRTVAARPELPTRPEPTVRPPAAHAKTSERGGRGSTSAAMRQATPVPPVAPLRDRQSPSDAQSAPAGSSGGGGSAPVAVTGGRLASSCPHEGTCVIRASRHRPHETLFSQRIARPG